MKRAKTFDDFLNNQKTGILRWFVENIRLSKLDSSLPCNSKKKERC